MEEASNVLFSIGPIEITGVVVTMWVIIAILTVLSILATRNLKDVPGPLQNLAEQAAVIGRVTFASGEQQEYTDAETFLQCIRDELPNHPVTGFRYETLTDDPAIRKQVDDILYDLYGEENPRPLEDYENTPQEGMTMGGMT